MNRYLPTYSREPMYLLALMGFLGKGTYTQCRVSFQSSWLFLCCIFGFIQTLLLEQCDRTTTMVQMRNHFLRNQAMTPKLQNNLYVFPVIWRGNGCKIKSLNSQLSHHFCTWHQNDTSSSFAILSSGSNDFHSEHLNGMGSPEQEKQFTGRFYWKIIIVYLKIYRLNDSVEYKSICRLCWPEFWGCLKI